MQAIRTTIEISKAIRNVNRLRDIVLVFAKNGFAEFISRGVISNIPNFVLPESKIKIKAELSAQKEKDWQKIVGTRLRMCFEELGPVFIKFGQLLSSREDLFDKNFIEEMRKLRDRVATIPFREMKTSIEKSLGQPINKAFQSFNENSIGSASIGVAYKAVLNNGDNVVVKARRPNIVKQVETDISILMLLASNVEKISDELKYLGLSRIVRDFSISIQNELNFNSEILNCEKLRTNLAKYDKNGVLYLPKMYKELSCEDLIVMEYISGTPFTEISNEQLTDQFVTNLEESIRACLKSFLRSGFFHADLHGGNFFLMENNQIALIDFGLMGNIGRKCRLNFTAIIYALLSYNYENLAYEFLDVAEYDDIPNVDELICDIREVVAPFMGLNVKQINFSQVLQLILRTLNHHKIYLPREWFIVFRALLTLDGVGKSLNVDVNIFEILEDDVTGLLKSSINKEDIIEESVWLGRDVLSSLRIMPRHLKWFVKEWSKNNYAFKTINSGYEKELDGLARALTFIGTSFISGVLIYSGTLFQGSEKISSVLDITVMSWIFWICGLILLLRSMFHLRR